MKIKKAIFVSIDESINDLEWKLPLIQEFKNTGYDVIVQLWLRSKYDLPVFSIYLLRDLDVIIQFKEEILNIIFPFCV